MIDKWGDLVTGGKHLLRESRLEAERLTETGNAAGGWELKPGNWK